jgi:exodeoxyribonuclease VII small subunit
MPETPKPERPLENFETGLEELEKVVKELEGGDLPLERALALFEKGVGLSDACRKQLLDAETRVEILLKKKNGELQPEPLPLDKE